MELWDAYDGNWQPTGGTLVRGEPIPDGSYHIVAEVLVRHVDGDFLLLRRDLNKLAYAGYYEAGTGGSALKGETPEQAALRELYEESGIKADKLTPIYRVCDKKTHGLYAGYLCVTDAPKYSIVLQEGETIAYKWLSAKEFVAFSRSDDAIPTLAARQNEYLKEI